MLFGWIREEEGCYHIFILFYFMTMFDYTMALKLIAYKKKYSQ